MGMDIGTVLFLNSAYPLVKRALRGHDQVLRLIEVSGLDWLLARAQGEKTRLIIAELKLLRGVDIWEKLKEVGVRAKDLRIIVLFDNVTDSGVTKAEGLYSGVIQRRFVAEDLPKVVNLALRDLGIEVPA